MIKTDFERYNARMNYNVYPVKWFKSGLNLGLSRTNSNYSTSTESSSSSYNNLARFIRTMAPIYPVHRHDIETGAYLDKDGNPTTDPSQYTYDYDAARISNNLGLEYDPSNYLLMHAMGPNVAGVIGSAVAAGVLLSFLG